MLQSIEIENFRCFEKTAISGFEQINLITGKNNSGKTALLEALFVTLYGSYWEFDQVVRSIEKPTQDQDAISNLYFNQNTDLKIKITTLINGVENAILKNTPLPGYAFGGSRNEDATVKFIADKSLQIPKMENLTKFFDDYFIKGENKIIEEVIRLIDEKIEEVRTFSSRPDTLFLRKKGEATYQPIHYFGDAIQKIIRYIINILDFRRFDKKYNILLIDEIENGIHYTAQAEVWRMLLKLCKHFNIQLFATTHSLEMIKAFQQVCSEEEFTGMGGYFELGRQAKSQQIIGIKHKLTTLEYELATDSPIRGE